MTATKKVTFMEDLPDTNAPKMKKKKKLTSNKNAANAEKAGPMPIK